MKVLVIGAAGKSGEALVNEALAAGHKVTAFVRGAVWTGCDLVQLISKLVKGLLNTLPAHWGD